MIKKIKFSYAWVIIGLCFMMIGVSLGLCSSGRNIYLTAITDALNIPRGAFSVNHSIRFVTSALINLYFGRLVARYGTKKLICAGFVCLIAFALINSFASKLYLFYIASIFLGIGLSWTGTSMVSTIINRWCTSNKGTITGAVLAANGLGGAIAVQIISPIIFQPGNPFGYRDSYHLVSLVLLVALVMICIFYKERPSQSDNLSDAPVKKRKARGEGWVGMDYSDALKKPYFYLTAVCIFLTGIGLQGLGGVVTPHMYDVGLSKEYVAAISSISSMLLMATKFSAGFSYDRFGMRFSMNMCLVSSFLSLIGAIFISNTPVGRTIALVRIIFGNVALPLETVMLPLYVSEMFGNKSFDKVLGVFVSVNYVGFALGSPIGNVCYDIFGDYKVSFVIFGVAMLFVTIAMQYSLSAAHRDKKKILEHKENEDKQPVC